MQQFPDISLVLLLGKPQHSICSQQHRKSISEGVVSGGEGGGRGRGTTTFSPADLQQIFLWRPARFCALLRYNWYILYSLRRSITLYFLRRVYIPITSWKEPAIYRRPQLYNHCLTITQLVQLLSPWRWCTPATVLQVISHQKLVSVLLNSSQLSRCRSNRAPLLDNQSCCTAGTLRRFFPPTLLMTYVLATSAVAEDPFCE